MTENLINIERSNVFLQWIKNLLLDIDKATTKNDRDQETFNQIHLIHDSVKRKYSQTLPTLHLHTLSIVCRSKKINNNFNLFSFYFPL